MKIKMVTTYLYEFAKESNQIEGINSARRHKIHEEALRKFLQLDHVQIPQLDAFVKKIEPSAFLRTDPKHRVWIGGKEAPSANESYQMLGGLLCEVENLTKDPWEVHCEYEHIHPFIDGNGRSGRALWLWMMVRRGYDLRYKFLQMFYYQTLSQQRANHAIKED